MTDKEIADVLYGLFWFSFVVWIVLKQGRYWWEKVASSRWPIVDAEIQRAGAGALPGAKGAGIPASFFGYRFVVDGIPRAGMFAVPMDEQDSSLLQKTLSGDSIQIRYDPADPDTSFLVDQYDSRFMGRKARQDPEVLESAPEFDLADLIKK